MNLCVNCKYHKIKRWVSYSELHYCVYRTEHPSTEYDYVTGKENVKSFSLLPCYMVRGILSSCPVFESKEVKP